MEGFEGLWKRRQMIAEPEVDEVVEEANDGMMSRLHGRLQDTLKWLSAITTSVVLIVIVWTVLVGAVWWAFTVLKWWSGWVGGP